MGNQIMQPIFRTFGCWLLSASLAVSCSGSDQSAIGLPTSMASSSSELTDTPSASSAEEIIERWNFAPQTSSGTGTDTILLTAMGSMPMLLTFNFRGTGMHTADLSEAYEYVYTKETSASIVWIPIFGNSTPLTVDTKGEWSVTIAPLSQAPSWDLSRQLIISKDVSVYKLSQLVGSTSGIGAIEWSASGCPVSSSDKQSWNPGGGGINGWWSTTIGKKRGTTIYLNFVDSFGRPSGLGAGMQNFDSQVSTYSGTYRFIGENIVAIEAFTDCKQLILKAIK